MSPGRECETAITQLTTGAQSSKETPLDILLGTTDLGQKIQFVSQDVEASLKCDPSLFQSLFMHFEMIAQQPSKEWFFVAFCVEGGMHSNAHCN